MESSSTESSSLSGGLMFGQKIYFGDGSGSGNGSNKNRRKLLISRCQVEGCRKDLSNAKAYYSRHKVCCLHSKATEVIVSGLRQRFCQQCSRFHQLSEFDLEKRSCRRRLACHNERRRKPQHMTSRYSRLAPSLYDPMVWSNTSRSVNVFSHGSRSFTTTTCPEMMNNNSTDSNCALSLLSNSNQNQQVQTQTNVWRPSSGFDSMITNGVTLAQSPPSSIHNQYMNQTWEFMAGEKSNSQFMSPVEPAEFQISNGTTMGGFELSLHQQALRQYMEPENTRAYDSSNQHFNWSL